MKAFASRGLAVLLAAAAVSLVAPARAQSLQPTVLARWVIFDAAVTVQGQDGNSTHRDDFRNFSWEGTAPFDHAETIAMDVPSPDGTAAAHLAGTMSQFSTLDPGHVHYEARMTATTSTSGTPGPGTRGTIGGGNGPRSDFLGMFFELTTPTTLVLTLHADMVGGGDFEYLLHGGTPDSTVFGATASAGNPIPLHSVTLHLVPGTYDMTANLDGGIGLGGQATAVAGFDLVVVSAIPEPQTWLLLAAGVPWLVAIRRRAVRRA
jgi:hypothetical protein